MRLLIFCLVTLIVSCYKDSNKEVDGDVYARVGPVELTQEDLVFFDNKTPDLRTLNSEIKTWIDETLLFSCLLYTSPSPRDRTRSRMPSSA